MNILLLSTVTIGVLHALAPDHWLPFVMLGRAQNWSRSKLSWVTILAGIGHVSSSLLIGTVGVLLGFAAEKINLWESYRGNIASLLLIGFGIAYMVWGLKNWGRRHTHHLDRAKVVSYWTLFTLTVFGPCEPLIPLIFAGSTFGWASVAGIFLLFGFSTIFMMLVQVHLASFGVALFRWHWFEHASDVVAGGVIALTGIMIRFLGI